MFDNINCNYPLPDGFTKTNRFQTKSLYNLLSDYTITSEGQLIEEVCDREEVPEAERPYQNMLFIGMFKQVNCRFEDKTFSGTIIFYESNISSSGPDGYTTSDDEPYWYREYRAWFDNGKLFHKKIEFLKDETDERYAWYKDKKHISKKDRKSIFATTQEAYEKGELEN